MSDEAGNTGFLVTHHSSLITDVDLWLYEKSARESGYCAVAGIDEVGRGPLAGPVVAAAVILPSDFDTTGIRDSKMMTAKQRDIACKRIVDQAVAVGVGIVGPETIDKVNILQATYMAMRAALDDLGAAFDYVLIDGNQLIPKLGVDQRAIVKGDSKSVSISAASIVAKVTRDCMMVELAETFPGYGFEKHKGYYCEDHIRAIEELGVCKIHRRSFAPICHKVNESCPQQSLF